MNKFLVKMESDIIEQKSTTILKLALILDKLFIVLEDFRQNLNDFQNNCKCIENFKNRLNFCELEINYKTIVEEYNQNKAQIEEELSLNNDSFQSVRGLTGDDPELDTDEESDQESVVLDHLSRGHSDSDKIVTSSSTKRETPESCHEFRCLKGCGLSFDSFEDLNQHLSESHETYVSPIIEDSAAQNKVKVGPLTRHTSNKGSTSKRNSSAKQSLNPVTEDTVIDNSGHKSEDNFIFGSNLLNKLKERLTIKTESEDQTPNESEFGSNSLNTNKSNKSLVWKCYLCPFRVHSEHYLRKHMRLFHNQTVIQCSICSVRFKNQKQLRKHQFLCFDPNIYICGQNGCSFKGNDLKSLEEHERSHSSSSLEPLLIKAKESSVKQLNDHLEDIRQESSVFEVRQWVCPYDGCGTEFGSKANLYYHNRRMHRGKDKISCNKCEFRCWGEKRLKKHLITFHSELYPKNTCPYDGCDYKSNSSRTLYRHYKAVHEKKLSCSMCSFKCWGKRLLESHEKSAHRRLFRRTDRAQNQTKDQNSDTNPDKSLLKIGATSDKKKVGKTTNKKALTLNSGVPFKKKRGRPPKAGANPTRYSYNCSFCEYKTSIKNQFSRHLNEIHNVFHCRICGQTCNGLNVLQKHLLWHESGLKTKNQFKCETKECRFECNDSQLFNEHKRQHFYENLNKIVTEFEFGIKRVEIKTEIEEQNTDYLNAEEFLAQNSGHKQNTRGVLDIKPDPELGATNVCPQKSVPVGCQSSSGAVKRIKGLNSAREPILFTTKSSKKISELFKK